jgi:glycosyltransferase involved in cell wall biosynthesis
LTIVRNIEIMDYPAVESIRSLLPLCDEFVVVAGKSDDNTLGRIKEIGDEKLRIIETEWDLSLRRGGQVLSQQTNIGFAACKGDWVFYLQADEVIHEKYHAVVRKRMAQYLSDRSVEGLLFRYKHFYGTYWAYQDNFRRWYPRETRVVRRVDEIVSWGDAMDFRRRDGSRLRTRPAGAEIYHYGWVKPPRRMLEKKKQLDHFWHDDEAISRRYDGLAEFAYPDRYFLVPFRETHPQVMAERVRAQDWQLALPRTPLRFWPIRKIAVWLGPLTKRIQRLSGKIRNSR